MSIRMLHISDLHLDCGFKTKEASTAALLRRAQHEGFKQAIDHAMEMNCHLVALTGDVFNDLEMSFKTEDILYNGISKLLSAGIAVVYVTGNHDYNGLKRSLRSFKDHPLFVLFFEPEPRKTQLEINGQIISLIGCGHHEKGITKNWARSFPQASQDEITVGFYHGMVLGSLVHEEEQEEPYMACTLQDLKCKNYQYWALGHIHKRQILDDGIAYAGSMQGIRRSETEKKGGWIVDISLVETRLTFLPLSTFEFRDLRVHLSHEENAPSLYAQLRQALLSAMADETGHFVFNVTLMGISQDYDKINHEDFCSDFLDHLDDDRVVDLKIDAGAVMPADFEQIFQSPYLSIAFKLLSDPQSDPTFASRLKALENQGIDALSLLTEKNDSLKNQLIHLFKEA